MTTPAPAQQPPAPQPKPPANPSPQPQAAQKLPSATDVLHFEKWLAVLGERKATDLHLSVGTVPSLRIAGAIQPMMEEGVITAERIERIAEHLLSSAELALLREKKQLVASKTLKKTMRFRIHFFYSRGFLGISMRNVPESVVPLSELPHAALLVPLLSATQGLFIVSGPFDSGKSATVASIIAEFNQSRSSYIVTLESPIERLVPSNKALVAQREVGRDVASYAEALAALAEEDVDVVALGDVPDGDVLQGALRLATSGRLVIAIMEGNHVVSVLERLRDMAPEEDRARVLHSLGDALIGIASQLLLPKVGGGRALLVSAMVATHPIKALIREGKFEQIPNIMQTSASEGMITTDKALVNAVKQGLVTIADARARAVDINQFNALAAH